MATTAIPTRRCTMPKCGQVMQARSAAPVVPGAVRVNVYRCAICDTRKCQWCDHHVQDLNVDKCPSCKGTLRLGATKP